MSRLRVECRRTPANRKQIPLRMTVDAPSAIVCNTSIGNFSSQWAGDTVSIIFGDIGKHLLYVPYYLEANTMEWMLGRSLRSSF